MFLRQKYTALYGSARNLRCNPVAIYQLPDAQDDFLFYKDKGVAYISGDGTSRKTLDLFIRLAEAVRAQDKPLLETHKAVSDSLCRVFKTYYPQEAMPLPERY